MRDTTGQMRWLTCHFALFQAGVGVAGGFIGAYLLQSGYSLAAALLAYAAYLGVRSLLRFGALEIVRAWGYRRALMLGTCVTACQYPALLHADLPLGFAAWILLLASGEALYWPLYHASMAACGESRTRGRQVAAQKTISTLTSVFGPLLGALLMTRCGALATFGLAMTTTFLSVIPLRRLAHVAAGVVPEARETFRGADRVALTAFAADGWISAGLTIGWPMVLFTAFGSQFGALGLLNAAAGLAGAGASFLCGRLIDGGRREALLNLTCVLMTASLALRGLASASPLAAAVANLTGAAVSALYVPVLMSVIYDRAKRSGATFRFHFVTEAGWDAGAVSGCMAAALVAWSCQAMPSLCILPAIAGVAFFHWGVRSEHRPRQLPLPEEAMAA